MIKYSVIWGLLILIGLAIITGHQKLAQILCSFLFIWVSMVIFLYIYNLKIRR